VRKRTGGCKVAQEIQVLTQPARLRQCIRFTAMSQFPETISKDM